MIAFTMDLDWATPARLNHAIETLVDMGIDKITFFVPPYNTIHEEDEVLHVILTWFGKSIKKHVGIHPAPFRSMQCPPDLNGISGLREAIDRAVKVLPKADFYRCHGLYDSHWLQKEMKDRGFKFCSNSCHWKAPYPTTRKNAVGVPDIPIWWEDSIAVRKWNADADPNPEWYSRIRNEYDMVINLHPQYIDEIKPTLGKMMSDYKKMLLDHDYGKLRGYRMVYLREMIKNEWL